MSTKRKITGGVAAAGVTAAAALATVLTSGSASANIPGVGNGLRPVTSLLDLVSATAEGGNALGSTEAVDYCFGSQSAASIAVNVPAAVPGLFHVYTYDSNRYESGSSASAIDGAPNCIRITFPNTNDLQQGLVATVGVNAVTQLGNGKGTYPSSVPLTFVAPQAGIVPAAGMTTAPDLVSVTTVNSNVSPTVTYTFDEPLDSPLSSADGPHFAVITSTGTVTNGLTGPTLDTTHTKVTVTFPNATAVGDAFEFFYDGNGTLSDPFQSSGGYTYSAPTVFRKTIPSSPVLTNVVPTGVQGGYTLTFSSAISSTVDTTKIFGISDDANKDTPSATTVVNGNTLGITFAATSRFVKDPGSLVRVNLAAGAVQTTGSTPLPAPPSEYDMPVSSMPAGFEKPGYTIGPDLLRTTVSPGTSSATFYYDEAVKPALAISGSNFGLLTSTGDPIQGTGAGAIGVDLSNPSVTVTFSQAFTSAVGDDNAVASVQDPVGNVSVEGSVSTTLQAPPPAPSPSPIVIFTPPPTQTPIVIPTTTPVVAVGVSIKSAKLSGTKVTGKLVSSRSSCVGGRTVTYYVKGKAVATAKVSGSGSFTIKLKTKYKNKHGQIKLTSKPGLCNSTAKNV